jgi:spore maturation protein A
MLNVIWPVFIIISVIYAIFSGNVENVSNGIFTSLEDVISLLMTLLGTMCFWNGIMEIARNTTFVDKLCKLLNPIINFLFPKLSNEKAREEISMNMVANFLGLGNAATPLGLKAMKTLQEENQEKDTLNDYMIMFIVLNTASLQLIPTNVIAIRNSLGSLSPSGIILPVWGATIISAMVGVFATKTLIKFSKKK